VGRSAAKPVLLQLADASGHDGRDGERRTEENLGSWGRAEAMSGFVMGLILKHSRSRGTSRLVAVAIGDCCEDDGTGAWPAVRTIAARAGTSERTAQRSIMELVQLGELAVDENAGPKRANLYTIRIDRLLANGAADKLTAEKLAIASKRQGAKSTRVPKLHPVREGDQGCQDERAEGDRIETEGDKALSSDPSSGSVRSDPSMDPSASGAGGSGFRYPDDFLEFWCVFPGTDGKRAALKAWGKLTRFEKMSAIADVPQRLLANWAGKELHKLPNASTYLNQRRWEDELQVNRIVVPAPPRLSPRRQELFESIQRDKAKEAINETVSGQTGPAQVQHHLDESADRRGNTG
jgi:hypothetical protein